jgi:citrate lyase subunit beta/citryl-CoA lyase
MAGIAAASERVVALTVGAEDLALDMGMRPTADALYIPNVQAVAAARAAGILPIGYVGTVADYADEERYRDTAERARQLGFAGGFCIHPKQVPILNAAFSPSAQEVADAEAIVAAYEAAERAGQGAVSHRGRMLDRPVVERARALLGQHAKIAAHKRT